MNFITQTKIKDMGNKPIINENVEVGKHVVIEGNVFIEEGTKIEDNVILKGNIYIGKNNKIGSNTVIRGNVEINDNNFISDFVSIGIVSQHAVERFELHDNKYNYFNKLIRIGNNNVIREFTTVHLPTKSITEIKDNCYIMAYCHISHDTKLFNGVILTNNAQIGGHTTILPYANLGLSVTIHPRITVGGYSMIGMGAVLTKNIIPFTTAIGQPAKPIKINQYGLRRNNWKEENIKKIIDLYRENKCIKTLEEFRELKTNCKVIDEQLNLFVSNFHENKAIAEFNDLKDFIVNDNI